MASPSVSFRISRSAEDLAETIHAMSQRLVAMEQRLTALELQIARRDDIDPEELTSLENVERLIRDCRDLLESEDSAAALPPAGGLQPDTRVEGRAEAPRPTPPHARPGDYADAA